jgi:hypothetical protein
MTATPHQRAAAMLHDTLVLGDADAWHGFSIVAAARLSVPERAALAWAVLRTLDPETVADIAITVTGDIGPPCVPLFDDLVAEADAWVTWASPRERAAYAEALAWHQA